MPVALDQDNRASCGFIVSYAALPMLVWRAWQCIFKEFCLFFVRLSAEPEKQSVD